MFIEDVKNDFYAQIKGKRVLILVNYDVDAICACKILQALFSTDGMLYSVVPVDFLTDLVDAFQERQEDEQHVILINCGGTVDIIEVLEPSEEVQFFVLDSHRPLDVSNVYSTGQVRMLVSHEDAAAVPPFDDIFRDDSESEEEDEIEDVEESIEKRRQKREWARRRDELMFEYLQYSYYSRSSAAYTFDLAWKLSKDNFDLLWYGIVGVSEQLLLNKVDKQAYLFECENLQQHISRLAHRGASAPEERGVAINIEFGNQLLLAMYRHWTLEASMIASVSTAAKLKLWTFNGIQRLHEMFAEMGIPLTQCRQRFSSVCSTYRQEFHNSLTEVGPRYGLDNIEITSFLLQSGYKNSVAAMDAVYGLIGLLTASKGKTDKFLDALEALSRSRREQLDTGMEICKELLQSIFRQVQGALETNLVRNAGPFIYYLLQEDLPCFSHPYGIILLAEFTLKAYSGTKQRSKRTLPLIVSTPCGENDKGEQICHIAAIPPLAVESNRTFFGKAFERASERSHSKVIARYQDASIIQILQSDRRKFLDAMVVLLS